MDRLLGGIINDYTLYKVLEGAIGVLSLVMIYLGIQIALTWKSLKKEGESPGEIIAQQGSFLEAAYSFSLQDFLCLPMNCSKVLR